MPKFIAQNPFRIFGVYANSSLRELTANKTRISAYAKVGRAMSFPLDNAGNLPVVERTPDAVASADHELAMLQNKITHSLFWFSKVTSIDEIAISHYINGDSAKAKELLSKKISASALVNLSVIGLIEDDYAFALRNIYTLVADSEMCASFVASICGDTFSIDPFELWKIYIDILLREKNAIELLHAIPIEYDGKEREYVKDKAIDEPIKILQAEICRAREESDKENPSASYQAGLRLMESAKKYLAPIKNLVGAKDLRYVNIADATATQILQCGINYFNATDDKDDVDKTMILQEFACSIAVGSLVSQRCQKNLEILKKKKDEAPINDSLSFIKERLTYFTNAPASISYARQLITDCKPHLMAMARCLGRSNELYVQVSSIVAGNALGMTISVVNANPKSRSIATDARGVLDQIKTMDMDAETRRRLDTNYRILDTNISNMPNGYERVDNATGGCLSRIVGWIIMAGIIGLLSLIFG